MPEKRRRNRKHWRWVAFLLVVATTLSLLWHNGLKLRDAAAGNVDAVLVLGGSITREIYVAQFAVPHPDIPILISKGSEAPCILLLFQREGAAIDKVWLENCANSTFGNFYFALPLLQQWGRHKVKLVTSESHLPRAQWMAQILLGSHGIWVDVDPVAETGVPGNKEFAIKTAIDVMRSLIWAGMSQVYSPSCSHVIRLSEVDLEVWQQRGFKCEHQAGLQ